MFKKALFPALAAAAMLAGPLAANAQDSMSSSMSMGKTGTMSGPDHGMPAGTKGGDGVTYTGSPDLQGAISLVTAGGKPGQFSIVKALTVLAGPTTANAEVSKLTKQYGAASVTSFVAVQNFAVDDAVKIATAAGVKFPTPEVTGKALAVRVVKLGLVNGTYYEGTQLDHLVTNSIHEKVMADIDKTYGTKADANYHKVADQAHYDLAQALGATTVKLAAYH